MKLNGAGAYQAAVHCATISAAKRIRMWQQQQRRQPSSGLRPPLAGTCIEPMHSAAGNPLEAEPAGGYMHMGHTIRHSCTVALTIMSPFPCKTILAMQLRLTSHFNLSPHDSSASLRRRADSPVPSAAGLSSPAASSQIETPSTPPRHSHGSVNHCFWDDFADHTLA